MYAKINTYGGGFMFVVFCLCSFLFGGRKTRFHKHFWLKLVAPALRIINLEPVVRPLPHSSIGQSGGSGEDSCGTGISLRLVGVG